MSEDKEENKKKKDKKRQKRQPLFFGSQKIEVFFYCILGTVSEIHLCNHPTQK